MHRGGGTNFSINEYDLYGKSKSFQCTNAYFTCGATNAYSQYLIGYLENGTLTVIYNYSNVFTVSYENGTLTLRGAESGSVANRMLKIMYE